MYKLIVLAVRRGCLRWRGASWGGLRWRAGDAVELLHGLADLLNDGVGIDHLIAGGDAEQSGVLLAALQ